MPVADILLSPVRILYSAPGTTLPANTLAPDAAWPAGWTQVGMTKEPLKWKYEFDKLDFEVQESLMAVDRRKTKETVSFSTVLSEFTGSNLALMWDGDLTTTPAGVGQPGLEELVMGDLNKPVVRQWGFEGSYEDEDGNVLPVRLFVWRATSAAGGEVEFGKSDYAGIPLEIEAVADMSKPKGQRAFKLARVTAPAEVAP